LTSLNAVSLNYTPPPTQIDPTPPTATMVVPQSTYGSIGFTGSPATVNIPVWWYAVLSMTSGYNHAVVAGLPSAADMHTYKQQVRLAIPNMIQRPHPRGAGLIANSGGKTPQLVCGNS